VSRFDASACGPAQKGKCGRFAIREKREAVVTIELKMLVWTLVLAFVQILLFDFARTGQYGLKWNTGPRDETMPPLSAFAGRLQRAQYNLYETLPLFVGGILVAHVAGLNDALTALGAQIYFWGRVVYVPLYAFGIRQIRSLVWLVSIAGLVAIYAAILAPHWAANIHV
jgi:uncharacterized MAPEG superfamily protein